MSTCTVMIVEDEADCAAMLELALEALPGVATVHAHSVEQALESARENRVALVISDLQLPDKSGLELISGVPGVPVVIVSASVDPGAKEAALRMGAAAFYSKPFSPSAVCGTVRELLARR